MKGYDLSCWSDRKMYQTLFKRAVIIGIISQLLFIAFSYYLMVELLTGLPLPGGRHISSHIVANYFFAYESFLNLAPRMIVIEPELRPLFQNQSSQSALPRDVYRCVLDRYTYNAFYWEKQGFKKAVSRSWWLYLESLFYIGISLLHLWKIQKKIIYNIVYDPAHPYDRRYQQIERVNTGKNVAGAGKVLENARPEVASQSPPFKANDQPAAKPEIQTECQHGEPSREMEIQMKKKVIV